MNKFTPGPWHKSKTTTVQGAPSRRFDSDSVSLIAVMSYVTEKDRDADEGTATLIENCTDTARALQAAKMALSLLLPYAEMHLIASGNRRGDTPRKRAARAEAFRLQAATCGAVGTLTDALKAGRVARDEVAAVLVNAVGEG